MKYSGVQKKNEHYQFSQSSIMTSSERISSEFDRYLGYGHSSMAERPKAEQIIYYVVIARCEKDMAGFASIFEQSLTESELCVMIEGLRMLSEDELAELFQQVVQSLKQEGYYPLRDIRTMSKRVKDIIAETGEQVGDRLWDMDDKLVSLLS